MHITKAKLICKVFIVSCVNTQLSFKKNKHNEWSNWSEWIIIDIVIKVAKIIVMNLKAWVTYSLQGYLAVNRDNES